MAVLTSLTLSALAQFSTFGVGEHFDIPQPEFWISNHASVAMNDRGDIVVAWDSSDTHDNSSVFAAYFPRNPQTGSWESWPHNLFLLGEGRQDKEIVCHKPDVVAAGNWFYVTWPRLQPGPDRLEFAAMQVEPDGSRQLLTETRPGGPAIAAGFVIDSAFDSAGAGVMPDLLDFGRASASGEPYAGVVYAVRDGELPRQYDLRYATIRGKQSYPPHVVVDGLLVDYVRANGGEVLPDVVIDGTTGDDFVLAYETFEAATLRSSIELRRFAAPSGHPGAAPALLDTMSVVAPPDRWYRRPSLASSFADGAPRIGLTWTDADAPKQKEQEIEYRILDLATWTLSPGPCGPMTSAAHESECRPLPVQTLDSSGAALELAIGEIHDDAANTSRFVARHFDGAACQEDLGAFRTTTWAGGPSAHEPLRPAVAPWIDPQGGGTLLAITCEYELSHPKARVGSKISLVVSADF